MAGGQASEMAGVGRASSSMPGGVENAGIS
jgi:hypothetical protein